MITLILSGCERLPEALETWEHSTGSIFAAALSHNGSYAVTSYLGSGIAYWNLRDNKVQYRWSHQSDSEAQVLVANFSVDGTHVVTSDDTRNFVLWETRTGQARGFYQMPADIRDITVANQGRAVLVGLSNAEVHFVDLTTGRRLEFFGHQQQIASVSLSPEGEWALTGGNDHYALLWSTQTGKPKFQLNTDSRIGLVRLSPSGKLAFTAGAQGKAYVWDAQTGEQLVQLKHGVRPYSIASARFSPDDSFLLTGGPNGYITLWDTFSGEILSKYKAKRRTKIMPSGAVVYAVGFGDSGRSILAESSAGYGQKWQLQ